jgi:hypothetical protein
MTPTDLQHKRDIDDIVSKAADELRRQSGKPIGLQQPK